MTQYFVADILRIGIDTLAKRIVLSHDDREVGCLVQTPLTYEQSNQLIDAIKRQQQHLISIEVEKI